MMPRILYNLMFLFIFSSCSTSPSVESTSKTEVPPSNPTLHKKTSPSLKDTTTQRLTVKQDTIQEELKCSCSSFQYINGFAKNDLNFSKHNLTEDTLAIWASHPDRLRIKSLSLSNFDTIPLALSMFKNVETIRFGRIDWRPIKNLPHFPHLKHLIFMGKEVDFNLFADQLHQIETIIAHKSKLTGLKSFSSLPKLKQFKIAHAGFDTFPTDFESLTCLHYFQIGAMTHGNVNLNEIDLSLMPCLQFVQFLSWHKNMTGIPKGIENIKTVKIHHANLTKAEKAQLKSKGKN